MGAQNLNFVPNSTKRVLASNVAFLGENYSTKRSSDIFPTAKNFRWSFAPSLMPRRHWLRLGFYQLWFIVDLLCNVLTTNWRPTGNS